MKILICGKGGSGKSTISALLSKEFARQGQNVLVIDTDESNFGIHMQLGMVQPVDFMNYFGGKKILFEKTKTLRQKWNINDLPSDYITEKNNIKLMVMGKIYDFGEGCACPINALASKFLEVLQLNENEYLIVDTDAGVEHFGRGVEKGSDLILAVIDPTYESIMLADKISKLGKQVNKPVYYILNKTNQELENELLKNLDNDKIIAKIPNDDRIFSSGLRGMELNFEVEEIQKVAEIIALKDI